MSSSSPSASNKIYYLATLAHQGQTVADMCEILFSKHEKSLIEKLYWFIIMLHRFSTTENVMK